MRKKSMFPTILVLLLLLGTNAVNYWYFNIHLEDIYKTQLTSCMTQLTSYEKQFYVAAQDITAGMRVTEEMLTPTTGHLSNSVGLMTNTDLGKTAIANISAGAILYSSMVYDETINPGNTAQFSDIDFPVNTTEGNYADIRIRFKNGSDYILISKTRVTGIDHALGVSLLTLNEKEHLYLSSAMVDAAEHKAVLYATIYSSPETQTPTEVSYVPRKETALLIYTGNELENYKTLRTKLEQQIGAVICE